MTLTMSQKGFLGAALMLIVLLAAHTALFRKVSQEARKVGRSIVFWDMIVTGDDNRYSLSRLQAYLWTVIVSISFAAVSLATGKWAAIPGNLVLLMGASLGTTVVSTAITVKARGKAPVREDRPNFIRDIFLESGVAPSLDLPRAQMFFWTITGIVTYVVLTLQLLLSAVPDMQPTLLDVPTGMVGLMGVSQASYLGAKVAASLSPAVPGKR